MMTEICFFVTGIPRPGGSKKCFRHSKTGKMIVTETGKYTGAWRDMVTMAALGAYKCEPLTGALWVEMVFYFPRPKSHFRIGKYSDQLKPSAPLYHTTKPDTTKLLRSTEDALTHIVWRDDSQIARQEAGKRYTLGTPGAEITIRTLEE